MEDTTVVENVKDQPVVADNPLKELFVQYVGEKLQPEGHLI